MSPIIDAHLHCSELADDELLRFARFNGLNYTLSELLELMKENNVEKGLLLSPPVAAGSIAPNTKILELCQKSGGKLFPIVTVDPSKSKVSSALKIAKANKGYVKGFKIRLGYVQAFADEPVFSPIYEYAESLQLPVLFHTGDTALSDASLSHAHPLQLDRLANRRQDLKIVICHFGNPWMMDVAELIYKHENVYADISGLVAGEGGKYSSQYLESVAAKISDAIYFAGGAEKVIFGTDYPVETFSSGLSLVEHLKIDREDIDKIVYKNALELFFSGH